MRYQRTISAIAILAIFIVSMELFGKGRGGGGFRGGGGGYRGGGSVVGPYGGGGAGYGTRSTGAVIGPRGRSGVVNTGSKSGSYTTKGGTTIDYKGAGGSVTGSGGGKAGRVVGGVEVTGSGGKSYTKAGTTGGAVGPGGKAVGGKTTVKGVSGPGGTAGSISRGKVAVGPGGAAVKKSGAVVGPHGGWAAYGARGVSTRHGTHFVAAGNLHGRGTYVRSGFIHYNCFHPRWYAAHPNAWRAAAWTAATFWAGAAWGSVASACGYPEEPIIYDYGSDLVYENDQVYYQGEPLASAEEYAEQATQIATRDLEAKIPEKEEWISLGVFAMVQGDEKDANNLFQFAINKDGVIRGNYYNALTDASTPVYGSVDKKTQRAAWIVGDRKEPVYETGIGNLTEPETSLLVHFGSNRTQQWTLVRMEPKEEK